MANEDRLRWDKVYREQHSTAFPAPDPLLLQYTPPGQGLRALDLAAGLGQNGLWLAEQGYTVDIMDISRVALNRARSEMAMRNLRNVNLLLIDLDEPNLSLNHYDLVSVFRYLKRSIWDDLKNTVRPGGRVIYETFNLHYLDVVPQFNTKYLLNYGELREVFANWTILMESEDDHISQIVAIKPETAPIETVVTTEKPPDLEW